MKHNPNTVEIPIVEEKDRHKGKKKKKEIVPKWKIDDEIVVKNSFGSNNALFLVKIISIRFTNDFTKIIYYGRILKVTQKKESKNIGELIHFYEDNKFASFISANVAPEGIKWIENYDEIKKAEIVQGWIGVDLDGTLAHYDSWVGYEHIGEPIPEILEMIKKLIGEGIEVRIFTARAQEPEKIPFIELWLEKHGIGGLEVTNIKDHGLIYLYDDRAYNVEKNNGKICVCNKDTLKELNGQGIKN